MYVYMLSFVESIIYTYAKTLNMITHLLTQMTTRPIQYEVKHLHLRERRSCPSPNMLSYNIEQKQKHCLDRKRHPLIIFEQNILLVQCTQYNKSLGRTNGAERKTIVS